MNFPIQKNKNIIIIGDIMLDQFFYGDLEDTSKEDPLAKILKVKSQNDNLGGAGNVAMNIRAMKSNPYLLGVVGNDASGQRIEALCNANKIDTAGIFVDRERKTTVKTRLYDEDQIIRYDKEDDHKIPIKIEDQIIQQLNTIIIENKIDGIILQDYNKGVLNKSSIKRILSISKKKDLPVFVDPKKDNFFEYQEVAIFKPNLREINWALPGHSFQEAAHELLNRTNCELTAITLSESGIYFSSKEENKHHPSLVNEIVDVCGAGDTVISILALTYLSKCNILEAGILANLAAADVCQCQGVMPINYEKLRDLCLSHYQDKKKYDIV